MMKKRAILTISILAVLGGLFFLYRSSLPSPTTDSDKLRLSLAASEEVELFEGLPHPVVEGKVFDEEVLRSDSSTLVDYHFYTPALEISPEQRKELISLLSSEETVLPFSGEKKCGGFHADFAVAWSSNGDQCHAFICFGCSEIIFTSKSSQYRYDLDKEPETRLKDLLTPLGKKRPKTGGRSTSNLPPEWQKEDVAKVVGYRFKIPGEDAKGNHGTGNFTLLRGPVVDLALLEELADQKKTLTKSQTRRLLNGTFADREPHTPVACYSPHQIFVFFDQNEKPIRAVEICFLCNGLRTVPSLPEGQWKRHHFMELAHLCNELGLWAHYEELEYYAPFGSPDFFKKKARKQKRKK